MTTGIQIYNTDGSLALSNEQVIMVRDYPKKRDLADATIIRPATMNPYLRNAKTKAMDGNTANCQLYLFSTWFITDTGVIYLYQPKQGCTIGCTTGVMPLGDSGQQGVVGLKDKTKLGYVLPVRLIYKAPNSTENMFRVYDTTGKEVWNLNSLTDCPIIVDIIDIPRTVTTPFQNWTYKWETPSNLNPDNIFFMSPNSDYYSWTEEGWDCSWMNFTRDGSTYWYVPGVSNPPEAYRLRPDIGFTTLAQAFSQDVKIFVFYVPNAT